MKNYYSLLGDQIIDNTAGETEGQFESRSRRSYFRLDLSPVEFVLEGMVLNCSKTTLTITPNEVLVEDYKIGFDDGNGNDEGWDLTF